jgi:hypothetical protein
MLLSKKYRFIYFKTYKTASTSTEIYFEKYCLPEDYEYKESHWRDCLITDSGIIGGRGNVNKETYYNHIPADELVLKLGEDVFYSYYKFANVRNPFDSLVSDYYFVGYQGSFNDFVKEKYRGDDCSSFDIIFMGKKTILDGVIRYENLQEDILSISNKLNLPKLGNALGSYKAEYRKQKGDYKCYYTGETREMVERMYRSYMALFGYSF